MRAKMGSAIAAAGMLLIAGCTTSTTAEGTAVVAEASATMRLDTGAFPVTPRPDFGTVRSAVHGRQVEGQRMAEYIVLPTELDSALTDAPLRPTTMVLDGPAALDALFAPAAQDIAEREGMIMGFSTSRADANPDSANEVVHAVFRFPDAGAATRAAQGFADFEVSVIEGVPQAVATPIAALPDTHTSTRTVGDRFSGQGYTAHGDYVIYTYAATEIATKDWAAEIITRGVEQQEPMIDRFPATPVAELGNLPIDIDDLLIYTLPQDKTTRSSSQGGVYGPRGAAHFGANPELNMRMFTKSNTTLMAKDGTWVYRSKNEAGAKSLVDLFAAEAIEEHDFTEAGDTGIPGTRCFETVMAQGEVTHCLVQSGRYVAEVSELGDQKRIYQMAAAQYLVLETAP